MGSYLASQRENYGLIMWEIKGDCSHDEGNFQSKVDCLNSRDPRLVREPIRKPLNAPSVAST
eukprot:6180258-Pleurochrysis_carterae.AAC.1